MSKNNFEVLQMEPEFTNSVLVTLGTSAVIFDAWGRADAWQKLLNSRKLNLRAIYATHGHSDHISAAPELAKIYNVPWFLNSADVPLILWGNQILDFWELPPLPDDFVRPTDLRAGWVKILGDIDMEIIAAPGHSAGGVMFYFPEYKILLSGDTIFRDGVGRTDLPGGNADELRKTISELIARNLPDDTYVVHGHGVDSMMRDIKARL
ncbi:MAG: MBL fold metallo-hydrolase [Alphaproteobacteria bacterium]|nr:MBL fold metallo-hydrolase [Alphaproteobacteria bacterium]